MLRPDEDAFFDYLLDNVDVAVLLSRSPSPMPQIVEDVKSHLKTNGTVLALWNKSFPLAVHHFRQLDLSRYDEREARYIATGETAFVIDMFAAPVIEYTPSLIHNAQTLQGGRIWSSLHRLEAEGNEHKGEEFERWYFQVAGWIQRRFTRLTKVHSYVGPAALTQYLSGDLELV